MVMRLGIALVMAALFAPGAAAAAGRPNLRVTALAPKAASVEPGAKLTVSVTTTNGGRAKAKKSSTRLYLSLDARKSPGDLALAAHAVPALKASKRASRSLVSTVPAVVARGSYRLIACADDRRKVKESNERDNCRTAAAAVRVGSAAPVPLPTVTPAPTVAATPTPAATATATPTATATATTTPTATPTATPDPTVSAQIAAARDAPDGAVSLPISGATVTKLKAALGSAVNDPAGFFIQAQQSGPALFVAVDPATLSPAPAAGDRVSFTITQMGTVGDLRRATAITGYLPGGAGVPVSSLVQVMSAYGDLVSNVAAYASEIASISGTVTTPFTNAGTSFVSAALATAGVPADGNLRVRAPAALVDALDLVQGCAVSLTQVPVWRFGTQAQLSPYSVDDVQVSSCPAPAVVSATALSATSVRVDFSRRIDPASVLAGGSQFTADNGLAFSAATVDNRSVVLTSTAQALGTTYTVTVANTVEDLAGTGVGSPDSAQFGAFVTPAVLRLTEVAPNITAPASRDLLELKAVSGGTLAGITITQTLSTTDTFVTMPNVVVQTGDVIVVHLNPDATAFGETAGKTHGPQATYPANYDTAWDVLGTTQNVTYTGRVLRVTGSDASLQDAVPFVTGVPSASYPAAVQAIQAAGSWLPADCTGQACTTTSTPTVSEISVDWSGVGTTATGNTVQRAIGAADTHTKNDWSVGPHTLGAG